MRSRAVVMDIELNKTETVMGIEMRKMDYRRRQLRQDHTPSRKQPFDFWIIR